MLTATLDAPAWKATSHGARSLYMALKRRYSSNFKNNGKVFLSQRDAAEEIGTDTPRIARWFRELQHFGFIVMTSPGSLGVDGKGKAPHWRLTELGYMHEMPTRDFDRWAGQPFSRSGSKWTRGNSGTRKGKPIHRARENPSTSARENPSTQPQKCTEKPIHTARESVGEYPSITSLPLSTPTPAGALQRAPTDEGVRSAPSGERASTPTLKPSEALLQSGLIRRAVADKAARGGAR